MQKKNVVSKGAITVITRNNLHYELGEADEKGERTISLSGAPLPGSDRWGVTFLAVGEGMVYFPAGCYDPDDGIETSPVGSIGQVHEAILGRSPTAGE